MIDLHFGATTDVGRVRDVNEDSMLAQPPVFVVADGMGGHSSGDVASRIAVEEFGRLARQGYDRRHGAAAVEQVLRASQQRIHEYAARTAGSAAQWYAGSTVVAALVVEDDDGQEKWLLVNLGDSRIYKLHNQQLDQVSVDHSVVQELIDAGRISTDESATHPERHVVTRALGGPGGVEPEFFLLPLGSAPRLVLCSDGVSGEVDAETMQQILIESPDPRDAADRLVAAAVEAGGHDNATAVVVDVVGLTEGEPFHDAETQRVSLEEKLGALP